MGKSSKLRYGGVAVAAAAAIVLGSGCAAFVSEPDLDVVFIGVDIEQTGPGDHLGEVFLRAIELRVAQVNDQGLLADRRLELRVRDNRSDPEASAANLGELAADDSVTAIITGPCGACVLSASDAITAAGVPTISLASSAEVVEPVEDRRHIFKVGPNANHNAGALATELRRAGVETVALVTTGDSYGEEGLREMQDTADRAGLDVVVTEQVTGADESVSAAAGRIAAYQAPPVDPDGFAPEQPDAPQGPDAVVFWTPGPVASSLAIALRDEGYEGGFFLDASAADEVFLAGEATAALDGARMVFTETLVIDDVLVTSPAKAARQSWFRDYLVQEGTYHAYASFAADAVQLIVEAINRFDSTDRESVRAAIEATQMEGLSGPIRMTAQNHSGLMAQALTTLVVRGGRWRPAG